MRFALLLAALITVGCCNDENLPFRSYPSESTSSIGLLWDEFERDALAKRYANKTVVFQATATIDGFLIDRSTYSKCHLESTK